MRRRTLGMNFGGSNMRRRIRGISNMRRRTPKKGLNFFVSNMLYRVPQKGLNVMVSNMRRGTPKKVMNCFVVSNVRLRTSKARYLSISILRFNFSFCSCSVLRSMYAYGLCHSLEFRRLFKRSFHRCILLLDIIVQISNQKNIDQLDDT